MLTKDLPALFETISCSTDMRIKIKDFEEFMNSIHVILDPNSYKNQWREWSTWEKWFQRCAFKDFEIMIWFDIESNYDSMTLSKN
jgi:hypothetical protein